MRKPNQARLVIVSFLLGFLTVLVAVPGASADPVDEACNLIVPFSDSDCPIAHCGVDAFGFADWTGIFYVGGTIGSAWCDVEVELVAVGAFVNADPGTSNAGFDDSRPGYSAEAYSGDATNYNSLHGTFACFEFSAAGNYVGGRGLPGDGYYGCYTVP